MNCRRLVNSILLGIIIVFLISGTIQIATGSNTSTVDKMNTADASHFNSTIIGKQIPAGRQVNVYSLYSKEPAPMGIADYGIGPSGIPYNYSTTYFLGHVNIKNLRTYNSSLNTSATEMTFQLNINFVFYDGSKEYVYWVQNVADFNTSSTPSIGFIDNVWNISAHNASVYNSTLTWKGTVGNYPGIEEFRGRMRW